MYFIYQVYKLGRNASDSLSLLSLGPKWEVKCYNEYFINGHMFYSKEYEEGKMIYNNRVCVKRFICNEFEVDYYKTFKEIIKLQYHSEQNIFFLIQMLLVWHNW